MQYVTHADLARDPEGVLDSVRGGEPALVEHDGRTEAAIVDIIDYRLLRATARHQAHPRRSDDVADGLTDEQAAAVDDVQDRYSLVLGVFLAGGLSLSRAAELLGTTYFDLRIRLHRLGLPTFQGAQTIEEAREEIVAADAISRATR